MTRLEEIKSSNKYQFVNVTYHMLCVTYNVSTCHLSPTLPTFEAMLRKIVFTVKALEAGRKKNFEKLSARENNKHTL